MNNNDSATETTNTRPTSGFTTNIKEITDADPMTGNNESLVSNKNWTR